MPLAFRSVHYDFRSRNGFQWPFPGQTAEAVGPFDPDNMTGCPSYDGDGICLATTAAGASSGGIPMHTVLVCEYDEADVLGQGQNGEKIRVRKAEVLSVDDFPAILRGVTRHADPLPTKANLSRANLSRANLSGANLSGANLSRAYLSGANLPGANLRSADLSRADLRGAYLRSANLSRANLSLADLPGANLSRANLPSADLSGAYLRSANLRSADLSLADLSGANLRSADLRSANLSLADLRSADLSGADLRSANLRSADLSGTFGDRWTALPEGYSVSPSGSIVREGAA